MFDVGYFGRWGIAGYSFIEVLLALSILSVFAIATFSFSKTFVEENHQFLQVNKLVAALQYTRMTAIRFAKPAFFCGSSNFKQCDGQWEKGQIITLDGKVMRVFSGMQLNDKLSFKGNFGRNTAIAFSPLGFTQGQQGSFYYTFKNREKGYRIILFHTGVIRLERILR